MIPPAPRNAAGVWGVYKADRAAYAKSSVYANRRLLKAWRNLKRELLRPLVRVVDWLARRLP